ncbi:hypothetical protein MMIN_28960 [Mycolicibacter minnesotensis]|nr:hypothetical protein MMIN_28960 [Mycolicibacter minnesotensis]
MVDYASCAVAPQNAGGDARIPGVYVELAARAVAAVATTTLTAISTLKNLDQSLSIPGVVLET